MAFALMLDSVRAIPARLAKSRFGHQRSRQKIVIAGALTPAALPGFFLENRKQSQWRYKDRKDKHPEQEVIHKLLIVENDVGGERELVFPGSEIVSRHVVGVVEAKFGANSD
jgi:hypothetical protein